MKTNRQILMKRKLFRQTISPLLIILLLIIVSSVVLAQEGFTRPLPAKELLRQITKEKFPNSDALIIIKEQSLQISQGEYFYFGVDIPSNNSIFRKVLIVKLLNESGVKKYGNFEYKYLEPFGNEIKNGFEAKVRVLKPDGTIYNMPESEIKIIITDKDKHGDPLARKAIFNVPNLAPEDVLQIEYQGVELFSSYSSALYIYDDEDTALYSNLYITLPSQKQYVFKSFPADKVGEPKVQQLSNNYGDGETYFWSMRSVLGTPKEPFSPPLAERGMMSGYYQIKKYVGDEGDWNSLVSRYYDKILDKGSVSGSQIQSLGFKKNEDSLTITKTDKLYTALRKYFFLEDMNFLYPKSDNIDDMFEEKKGNSTDVAFIMYKILERWGVKSKAVFIRDRREGAYHNEMPSMVWFDRIGLLVEIDGKERLYDFDRSLPTVYENPWYLNNINMPVIDEETCIHKKYSFTDKPENNISSEIHRLQITGSYELKDSLEISYSGSFAQRLREQFYGQDRNRVTEHFKAKLAGSIISTPEDIELNNFNDEKEVKVRITGSPVYKAEVIDTFLTFNLSNLVLREFRDKLLTSKRYNDISFDSPYLFNITYEVPVPEGYKLYNKPTDQEINYQPGMKFSIRCSVEEKKVLISASEAITSLLFPVTNYNDIIKHLESALKEAGKELVFVKIKGQVKI